MASINSHKTNAPGPEALLISGLFLRKPGSVGFVNGALLDFFFGKCTLQRVRLGKNAAPLGCGRERLLGRSPLTNK
jgi:hypothetical protein